MHAIFFAVMCAVPVSSAHADTLATRKIDVTGDGVVDTVTVDTDGTVTMLSNKRRTVLGTLSTTAWRIKTLRIESKQVGAHHIVLVRAAFLNAAGRGGSLSDAIEVAAFEWSSKSTRRLFSETAGPASADADLLSHIVLRPDGLFAYQSRAGITRCDQKLSRLNVRKFDFAANRFRPVTARPRVATQTAVLTASRSATLPTGLNRGTRARAFRFVAASTHTDGARPTALDDDDAKTSWSEARGGYGRGDFFTARARTQSASIVALRFIPGDAGQQRRFLGANRLRRLLLVTDRPGSQRIIVLPVDPARNIRAYNTPYWIVFKKPLQAKCVSVVIDDVFFGRDRKAPQQGRTAISEFAILTEADLGGVRALPGLASTIADGGRDAAYAERRMLSDFPRPATVDALLAATKAASAPAKKRRLWLFLARIGDATAGSELARALAGTTDDRDFVRYSQGLRKMGAAATDVLAALLASTTASQQVRLEAAVLLGANDNDDSARALLAICGRGDRDLRNRVDRALAKHQERAMPLLSQRLADEKDSACASDLWRVISLPAMAQARTGVADSLIKLLTKRMANNANSVELRTRLLQAAAAMVDHTDAHQLLTEFMATPNLEPALRRVVLDALPRGTRHLDLLRPAVVDPDPGVRRRAIRRLARGKHIADDKALIERLLTDAWPTVRVAAARGLGERCTRTTVADALVQTAQNDKRSNVQRAAIMALVQCKSPRLGSTLLAIVADRRHDRGLREKAAGLLGKRQHRHLAEDTVRLFRTERQRAFRSGAAVRVAARLAKTLGRLGDPVAQKPLLDAAQDATFPYIQASAIDALGRLCSPGTRQFLLRFAGTRDLLIGHATQRALRRCRR